MEYDVIFVVTHFLDPKTVRSLFLQTKIRHYVVYVAEICEAIFCSKNYGKLKRVNFRPHQLLVILRGVFFGQDAE
jgi:hypothetical protein